MKRYKRIARDITNNFKVLNNQYSSIYNNEQILYASGLIFAFSYIHQKRISLADVGSAAIYEAQKGECGNAFAKITHIEKQEEYYPSEVEKLINFVIQLEFLIFNSEPHESFINIPQAVVGKKKVIQRIVKKTIEQGELSPTYFEALDCVESYMSNDLCDEFKDIIKTIKIGPYQIVEDARQNALKYFMSK